MKLRNLIAACLLAAASWASANVELPVTEVNGKACYCYTVGKNKSLYSVADELGLTRDEILKYNPGAADGIRKGQKLYFPVEEFPGLGNTERDAALSGGTYTVRKGDSFYGICYKLGVSSDALLAANPSIASGVKVGQVLNVPSELLQQQVDNQPKDDELVSLTPVRPTIIKGSPAESDTIEKTANIVVMLPFKLNSAEPDRQALNVTDFYKGLLMAADSLSNRQGKVAIYAFDTEDSAERVKSFCLTDTFRNAAVVIAPDNKEQLATIAAEAAGSDLFVFNAFVVRDSSYLDNPYMLQSYIPSDIMLSKAVQAVQDLYPGSTPVVLRRQGGREDKADFIELLTRAYADSPTPVLTISYDEALTAADFASLPDNGNYVLIPVSGSLAEFNKLSAGVLEARTDGIGGSDYHLFGYPDWTSFRGPTAEMLHRLGATIYTRFYTDTFAPETKQLEAKYNRDFGGTMLDAVPVPALLGFDTGHFLINNLRRGESRYMPQDDAYYGVQSSFRFVKAPGDDGGYYNDELYIIRYSLDGIHTDRLQ